MLLVVVLSSGRLVVEVVVAVVVLVVVLVVVPVVVVAVVVLVDVVVGPGAVHIDTARHHRMCGLYLR